MWLPKKKSLAFLLAVLVLIKIAQPAFAQGTPTIIEKEEKHDVSPPLRTLPPLPPQARAPRVVPLGWIRRHGPRALQVDPVVQGAPASTISTTSGSTFEGIGDGVYGFTVTEVPPDPNGAAGLTQFVEWVNTSFAVFNKSTGALIYGPAAGNTLWQGFGGPCENTNNGDPIAQYDKIAHRWVMTQFANQTSPTGPFYQCVAVSQTEDATGAWHRYSFTYSNNLNDYPKLAVWPDAYYISYNLFPPNQPNPPFQGAMVCAFDRQRMLTGASATQVCFTLNPTYGGVLPSDLDGYTLPPNGSPNYVVGYQTPSSLNLWKFHVDFATPVNSTLTGPTILTVPNFNEACTTDINGACTTTDIIPQPGTGTLLDSLGDRPMYRLAYRNLGNHQSLVVNHSVRTGNGNVGVRWYELRDPNGTPLVYQKSTWVPDSDYRWMGSIAMDSQGNMALGYSVSSSTTYPSIRYTGRLASDTLDMMGSENAILAGTRSQTTTARWGDYTSMVIDPADDCTFWYTNEYMPPTSGNWHTRIASFKFPSCTPPVPSPVSVTPSSGVGTTQTFSYLYSDPRGFGYLAAVQSIINSSLNYPSSCSTFYNVSNNLVYLLNDSGTTWLGPATLGNVGTLQNSQCTLDVGASSVSGSGNNLTLNLALSFTLAFGGPKNVYMWAQDNAGADSGWQQRGTWTTTAVAAVSVTPSSGSGPSQTFSYLYSDPNGFGDIAAVQNIINSSLGWPNSCSTFYDVAHNLVYLLNDAGTNWGAGKIVGQTGTLQNSQCTLDVGASSASGVGNNLTLNLALTFTQAFVGTKNLYMWAQTNAGANSGWQQRGTWTTATLVGTPPSVVSVTPNSGNGSSQTFTYVYSDPNGYAWIDSVQNIINSGLGWGSSCSTFYNVAYRLIYLLNDTATAWQGPMTVGQPGTLQNSQCTLDVGASSVSGSSTNLTLNLAFTFTSSFAGIKHLFSWAQDNVGAISGWQLLGSWTTFNVVNQAPSAVSVTPNSGSGSSQTFSYAYSDANGYGWLAAVQNIINSSLSWPGSCSTFYDVGGNLIYLLNDAGNSWGNPMTLGQPGTLSNSQCTLNAGASSALGTGNKLIGTGQLTLNLALTFTQGFGGTKNLYLWTQDQAGLDSGWQPRGTWTVP